MHSIPPPSGPRGVAVGIDTHKHVHVAVALDELGGHLGELSVPADRGGYARLEGWAMGFGKILAFGSRARHRTASVSRATCVEGAIASKGIALAVSADARAGRAD